MKEVSRRWISDIRPGDHLCWVFDAAEEQLSMLAEFISSGVERKEKTLLLTSARSPSVLAASLSSLAVPVAELTHREELVFRRAESTALPSWLTTILRNETSRALAGGHSGLRVAWETGLPSAPRMRHQRLAATESAAHAALSQIRCSLLCQYDRRALPATLLQEVIALHPLLLASPEVPGTFARGLIEQSVDGIALVDEDNVIIEWNAAMAQFTGVPRQAVLHRHVMELSRMMSMDPPLLRQTVKRMNKGKASFRKALAPELLQKPFEVRLLHATALERVARVKLFPVRLSGRVIVGALLEDITEKKRTEQLLADSRKELRNLALHLLAAREEERKTVASEIHDELGQSLTALKMDILQLGRSLTGAGKARQEMLADMTAVIDQSLSAVQRIATDLRPRMLDDLGLPAAIRWLCNDFGRRTGFPCAAQIDLLEPGPVGAVATSVYRIAQELLTNVARHAMARRVSVQLTELGRSLRLIVRDDGVGITSEQASSADSIGLIGIRERLKALQGRFSIIGTKGGGTTARVSIPLRRKEPPG